MTFPIPSTAGGSHKLCNHNWSISLPASCAPCLHQAQGNKALSSFLRWTAWAQLRLTAVKIVIPPFGFSFSISSSPITSYIDLCAPFLFVSKGCPAFDKCSGHQLPVLLPHNSHNTNNTLSAPKPPLLLPKDISSATLQCQCRKPAFVTTHGTSPATQISFIPVFMYWCCSTKILMKMGTFELRRCDLHLLKAWALQTLTSTQCLKVGHFAHQIQNLKTQTSEIITSKNLLACLEVKPSIQMKSILLPLISTSPEKCGISWLLRNVLTDNREARKIRTFLTQDF